MKRRRSKELVARGWGGERVERGGGKEQSSRMRYIVEIKVPKEKRKQLPED